MAVTPKKEFVFKKHMKIGEADAESDEKFLQECFIDVGDCEVLEDTTSTPRILLGRTGVGKSALISQIENSCDNVVRIEPEDLALRHISNSTVLKFFEDLGVNLDIFYSLLWQHTFCVELIKKRYGANEECATDVFTRLADLVKGKPAKREAIEYIKEWGEKFWLDTETRIKEFTEKLEDKLNSEMKANIPSLSSGVSASSSVSEEVKSEVVTYGKRVVNQVQISKLSRVVSLLSEDVFSDPQRKYYIVIDRLDENWVDGNLRYKLIKALIETIRKFRSISAVKIIITLRQDLLNRVLDNTQDSGFQPEKYESYYLRVEWNKSQIVDLLDSRVSALLSYKYTNNEVKFSDVFPSRIDKVDSVDYIIDRTLLRPRDAIMFVNECFVQAQGKAEITGSIIKKAEQEYSRSRLESLQFEWQVEHPNLDKYLDLLQGRDAKFKVSMLSDQDLEELVLVLCESTDKSSDLVTKLAHGYIESSYPESGVILSKLRVQLLFTLYKIGVVGIKVDGNNSYRWSHDSTKSLTHQMIKNNSMVIIHKMLHRVLGIDGRHD